MVLHVLRYQALQNRKPRRAELRLVHKNGAQTLRSVCEPCVECREETLATDETVLQSEHAQEEVAADLISLAIAIGACLRAGEGGRYQCRVLRKPCNVFHSRGRCVPRRRCFNSTSINARNKAERVFDSPPNLSM